MAGASDDEEMNYWPGFVDALSTMTMMLIFLMLILALVIVSVSQNVSRAQIAAIASAAKIPTSGASASIDTMTAQIISVISQLTQNQNTSKSDKIKDPQKTSVPVESQEKPTDTQIVSERKADLVPFGGGVDVQSEKTMITLIFQPRALRPDDVMLKKFSEFMATYQSELASAQFEIQAVANTSSGQITEARRLAYYRAMIARQLLLDQKINTQSIRVTIVDKPTDDPLDYVKIFVNP